MKWTDNRQTSTKRFGDLEIEDVFVWDNIIHIKINRDEAFDICNDITEDFESSVIITPRKATLVLD